MSFDWQEVRLEDVTTKLGDGLHGTPKYDSEGEYYFINGNNLKSGKIVIDEKTKRTGVEEYQKHKKELNDRTILVSINGTLGNIAFYNGEKVFLGKSACYFHVKEDVDKNYIRYVLEDRGFQSYINNLATGSTIKNVSLKLMRDFTFRLPPLRTQTSIASVLKSLDDKIQLNQQINQTLEQMAQAIFKSWFVDFEPVKAKIAALEAGGSEEDAQLAAIQAISGKDLDQLAIMQAEHPEQYGELRATAELFPAAMQDSELGDIPEGWNVEKTENLSDKIGMGPFGSNIKVSTFVEKGIPVISGQHLKGTLLTDGDNNFITEEHADRLKNSNVYPEDIIFTHAGSIGQVSIIPAKSKWERYVISQRQFFLRADKEKASPYFLTYFFRSFIGQHLLLSNASQVGVPSIARPSSHLKSIELVTPPVSLQYVFEKNVKALNTLVIANRNQNETLTSIKDNLLPKLLSGELEV